jgi:TonB family protein
MRHGKKAAIVFFWMIGWVAALGQTAPEAPVDADMTAASLMVGRALFLRGFYLSDALTYDAAGKVQGAPKVGDWTLSAVNVVKVERRGTGEIELDGVRAAVRYNTDNHEFERHVLKDEKVQVVIVGPGDAKRLEAVLAEIFSVGIDPEMQRTMPDYWRHYFNLALAWPQDALDGQTIYPLDGAAEQSKDVTGPKVEHRVEAKYNDQALRDKVQGSVELRVVVDASGVPRRVAIARPLGYGLDASAVEAIEKWRFTPGMRGGSPVATSTVVEQQFSFANQRP